MRLGGRVDTRRGRRIHVEAVVRDGPCRLIAPVFEAGSTAVVLPETGGQIGQAGTWVVAASVGAASGRSCEPGDSNQVGQAPAVRSTQAGLLRGRRKVGRRYDDQRKRR